MNATSDATRDFFLSRSGSDAAIAERIAGILEAAGHSVLLQDWDFANHNFIERMHTALQTCARVIALLSPPYLASDYCSAEWLNRLAGDPLNRQGRLILLRVAPCEPGGMLTALQYWDAVPVGDDPGALRTLVLGAIQPGRHKPDDPLLAQYWRDARPLLHPEIRATASFTGRARELGRIAAALAAGETAAVTQAAAVHGLGGIGKSTLAREFGWRHRQDYAGVWWLTAERAPDGGGFDGIEAGLVQLGSIFLPGLEDARDRAAAARDARELINGGGFAKPWLLIYDNVDDPAVLRDWPATANARLLLTTRRAGWPRAVQPVEVEDWEIGEAIAYLREESGRDDLDEAAATQIAEALGRLPLALSHAAAFLRQRHNFTAKHYLDGLTRRMNEAPAGAEYARAVFATFRAAIEQAEAEAPGARAVIALAAFLAPDDIPEELFTTRTPDEPAALAAARDAAEAIALAIASCTTSPCSTSTRRAARSRCTAWYRPPPATPWANRPPPGRGQR